MKSILTLSLAFFCGLLSLNAQRQSGLLWEITGNGLTKPSYVYGTMHVSDKVAFHLGDPFFKAIKSVDIVALEQSLDSVYDKWLASYTNMYRTSHGAFLVDNESFKLTEYTVKDVAPIIQRGPLISNAILYRVNQLQLEYQEESFLDMLIYRLGKRYQKQVTGVEDFMEAHRLTTLAEAKEVRRSDAIGGYGSESMSDFYRTGDLTAIDSLNKVTYSDNYLEYMLFRRNQNMVKALNELMKKGAVFCGVGCAHLPGEQGVLELLEKMGYTVKSIKSQSNSPSKQLEKSKKIKVSTPLSPRISDDHFFSADVPGKIQCIYQQNSHSSLYVSLDIPAGAQYLVYRFQDFPSIRNKKKEDVLQSLDSFLYEIVLGKPDAITTISNDPAFGTQSLGFDIVFTRKNGDKGHYKLVHTGSELVLVAVTGLQDFATGKEANSFFSSFKLLNAEVDKMITLTSPDGLLSFQAPGDSKFNGQLYPFLDVYPSFNYTKDFEDHSYIAIYRSLYNGHRLRPDTTELLLCAESFAYSHKLIETKSYYEEFDNRPARYSLMRDKDGNKYAVRVSINGFKYFLQAMKDVSKFSNPFFTSVQWKQEQVTEPEITVTDTFCHFTAVSRGGISRKPVTMEMELVREQAFFLENKQFGDIGRSLWFSPDNDREFIEIHYNRYNGYTQFKDSARFWKNYLEELGPEYLQVISKEFKDYDYGRRLDVIMGDTGSSRRIKASYILSGSEHLVAIGFYDTINGMGEFTSKFFATLKPVFKNTGNIFQSKVPQWTADINSTDSSLRRKAWDGLENLLVDSFNVDYLVKVYDTMQTSNELVQRKRSLIFKMGISRTERMIPVLERIYKNAGDTAALQTAVIGALGYIKTKASYAKAKELFFLEPPIPDERFNFDIGRSINDSLKLAGVMFPDLFSVLNIEDYKEDVIAFACTLLDSQVIKPTLYSSYIPTLASEANLVVKKVLATESATKKNADRYNLDYDHLYNYVKLLLPYQTDPKVITFLDKAKTIKERDMKLKICVLMLKNNYPVEDSVFTNLANEKQHKVFLYNELKEAGKLSSYPLPSEDRGEFSKSFFYVVNKNRYIGGTSTVIDSVIIADSAMVTYWNKKEKHLDSGMVYLMKFNRKKNKSRYEDDEDNEDRDAGRSVFVNTQYYYGIAGPQPGSDGTLNSETMVLNSEDEVAVLPDMKQKDEFSRLIRKSQITILAPGFYSQDW